MRIGAYDLGVFAHSFWNTVQGGRFMFNSMEGVCHFAIHFSPSILFLVPLFSLAPRADTLIIAQTVILAAGIFPLYFMAARRWGPKAGTAFAALYVLYPPLHGINYHEFHEVALACTFYLYALYFFDTGRPWGMWLFLIAALGCKEDQSLVVFCTGLAMILDRGGSLRGRRIIGGAAMALGVVYYFLLVRFIIPSFGGNLGDSLGRYAHLGNSAGEILVSPILRPGQFFSSLFTTANLGYTIELVLPLAFLCCRSIWILPALPTFLMNTLSSFGGMHVTNSHYAGALIPFLFYAAVRGMEGPAAKHKKTGRAGTLPGALKAALVLSVLCMLFLDPVPLRIGRPLLLPDARSREARRLMEQLPPGAGLTTPANFYPHVCNRPDVFPIYNPDAELIFIDESDRHMIDEGRFAPVLAGAGTLDLAAQSGTLKLLRRKAKAP